MKKLNVFGAIIGFAVIASIAGYAVARPVGISLAAQEQFGQITESLTNLWQKIGQNIFPAGLDWNVGIGTKTPSEKLSVAGTIESISGGFKFPDGTIQQTAQLVGPQGPQGPQGDPGAQGPPGPAGQQLHLYDANGQDLGIVLDSKSTVNTQQNHHVYLTQLGLVVSIAEFGFTGSPSTQNSAQVMSIDDNQASSVIFFTDTNCSVSPFLISAANHYSLVRSYKVNRYFVFNGVIGTLLAASKLDNGVCGLDNTNVSNAFYLQEISLPFTEPLAWPLHIQ